MGARDRPLIRARDDLMELIVHALRLQRDPSQAALWGSWIELGEKFFRTIIAHPIPLDMRALKALKRSPLALDLYSWLTYEAYRTHKTGKGRFVAWRLLAEQMGADYADTHDFQKKAVTLRKIRALYPALKLGPKAKNIQTAEELVRYILDAFLSSQEETIFGESPKDFVFVLLILRNNISD